MSIFDAKSPFLIVFITFYLNKWFSHLFDFFFCDFVVLVQRCFVRRLCAALFVFPVLFSCLFGSGCQISFDQVQSMTLMSSTLQIRRLDYSKDLNIHIWRLMYVAVLCYSRGCCEFVHRFILFVLSKFALYQFILSIWMNKHRLFFIKKD